MDTLPVEMINEIANHLCGRDLLSLASTCKDFNLILKREVSRELESMQLDKILNYNRITIRNYKFFHLNGGCYLKCIFCGNNQHHLIPVVEYCACEFCISEYNLPKNSQILLSPPIFYLVCNCIQRKLRLIVMSKKYKYDELCNMIIYKKLKNIVHDSNCDRKGIYCG